MIKSSLFYFKKTMKSPLVLIVLAITVFLSTKIVGVLDSSLFQFTQVYYFVIICTNLFMLVSTSSFMSKNFEALLFLERDKCKKMLVSLGTSVLITLTLAVLPVVLMIFFNNAVTDIYLIKNAIIHFLIIWILSNILAATIGSIVGVFLQNGFSTVIAVAVYIPFVLESQKITNKIIHRYLNIFDDHTFVISNDLSGPIFDVNYIMDKLFVVFLILILILITYIYYSNSKRVLYIGILIIIICCMTFIVYQGEQNQVVTEAQIVDMQNNSYVINSYKMKLILTNNLENTADLSIKLNENVDELELLLNDVFRVKKIEIDGEGVTFSSEDNIIKIQSSLKRDQSIQLKIKYEGNVNIENDLGVETYYVHNRTINLPGDTFAWYPQPLENEPNQKIKFNVDIQTQALLFSNINFGMDTIYSLEGNAASLSLFAGNYRTFKNDGIDYIIPSSYNLEQFKATLDSTIEKLINDKDYGLSIHDQKTLKNKSFHKVIVGVWPDNISDSEIKIVDNVILVKYINY